MKYRINKFLATSGLCSRRKSEEYITDGRVSINGNVVRNLATYVDSDVDTVTVDGDEVRLSEKKVYLALNKPEGYICTDSDPEERPLARELIDSQERLFSIGRLDIATRGLIIYTNDGDFAHKMAHPRYEMPKTYHLQLNKALSKDAIQKIEQQDYLLEDGKPPVCTLTRMNVQGNLWSLTLHEGRNRIVRRIFEALDYKVIDLIRLSMGSIELGHVKEGYFRHLHPEEVKTLLRNIDQ